MSLPLVPQTIGLITQINSEGYNDFLGKLRESKFAFKVKFYNSSVQGKNVEPEVCVALDYFNTQKKVDAIVITRGGGSKTDLSWFDNKKIAEKIAFLRTPVLIGIGHKTDYTITDMVAFSSQQSPTAVATFLIDHIRDVLQELKNMRIYINKESYAFLRESKKEISRVWPDIISDCKQFFKNTKNTINNYKIDINSFDPINILQKGFSITKVDGKAIKSINKVRKGNNILTIVSDGEIRSIVNLTKKII
jgi:exodeoxyribonuclease VII large subunit